MGTKLFLRRNLIFIVFAAVVAGVLVWQAVGYQKTEEVAAGANHNVSGWAWSNMYREGAPPAGHDPTIGWISFNSTNCDKTPRPTNCPTGTIQDYGVNIKDDGTFEGYAWVGWKDGKGTGQDGGWWISFNEDAVSGCPSAPCQAQVNLENGQVSGWARVCTVFENPDACSGTLDSNRGGWDGWIKLRGVAQNNTPYGVSIDFDTGEFSGWAWSDMVIGWISFNTNNYPGGSDYKVMTTFEVNQRPTVSNLQQEERASAYCGLNPSHYFKWDFSDPEDGSTQHAYHLQISNDSAFTSIQFNSGKVESASTERYVPVVSNPSIGQLGYNRTYYWRVQVYDSEDASSGWFVYQNNIPPAESFTTPPHAYPWPNFSWQPSEPTIDEVVQFCSIYEEDVCEIAPTGGWTSCDAPGGCASWLWTFPDDWVFEEGYTSSSQNPRGKFTTGEEKEVRLEVTDTTGYTCSKRVSDITTQLPLPDWWER